MKNTANLTLQDIAQRAGVSKATVSLVFNGSPKISSKTCERVWAVIHKLNYQPNEEARKLAQRRWSSPLPTALEMVQAELAFPGA